MFGALGVTVGESLMLHVPIALSGGLALVAAVRALDRGARRTTAVAGLAAAPAVESDLEHEMRNLGDVERRVVAHFVRRAPVARDPNTVYEERLTVGERLADRVAAVGGSWTFLVVFGLVLVIWIALNAEGRNPFDPYPFILLNLLLSCLAAIQAPVIMMSQHRLSVKDRIDAHHDYQINLKAELEILSLHEKLDAAREQELKELLALQERQLQLLMQIERLVQARETQR